MNPVRLGIIGCGVIGRVHLQSASQSPLTQVVAVADTRAEAATAAATQFGVPAVYTEADALLGDPNVEAVVLALPAYLRTELALRAFARGKHVLTEKPVAMNADEVRRMLAARGDRVAACASSRMRFLASAQVAQSVIASGELGHLRVIRCRAIREVGQPPQAPPPPWRLSKAQNGGGILMNWGVYDLDYLLGLTGWQVRPESVLAQVWPVAPELASHVAPGSDAEAHFAALIKCAGGTVITFERGEYVAARTEDAWQIVGSRASLRLHMTPGRDKRIILERATPDRGLVSETIWQGDETWATAHAGPLVDFAEAIRTGREPATTLERALIVQQVFDAVYRSADTGAAARVA